jgi:ATP-binding cassette, subfamily B, bacterial
VLLSAAAISALAGVMEVLSALILGWVIDAALEARGRRLLRENWLLLAGFAAFFVLRPLAFGASSAANTIVVQPNVNPLVLARLNRWTLGQPVTFFDNDFAGRIAQKQVQTARALTDVANEIDQHRGLRAGLDHRLGRAAGRDRSADGLALAVWMVGYLC